MIGHLGEQKLAQLQLLLCFPLLLLLLSGIETSDTEDIDESYDSSNVIKWSDLSLTTNCPDEVWQSEVNTIRTSLTTCLGVAKILINQTEEEAHENYSQVGQMYTDGFAPAMSPSEHPHCQLAEKWNSCWHYLDGLSCIQADSRTILKEFNVTDVNSTIHDLSHMTRVYEESCKQTKGMLAARLNVPESMDFEWGPPEQDEE